MSSDGIGRYRRAYPRIFRHPGFQQLTPTEQRLAFYLLFGPQTNRIGLFHFSIATAAEELNVGVDTLRKALSEVTTTFGWMFDADARVFYVPSHWRWNRPDHAKVLQGNMKDLSELPPSALVEAFASNIAYLPPELHETFLEACRIRIPKAPSSQYQDQKQKQKQKLAALRAGLVNETVSVEGQPKPEHLEVARKALKTSNPNGPIEDLVDGSGSVAGRERPRIDFSHSDAVAAIRVALSERRNSVA